MKESMKIAVYIIFFFLFSTCGVYAQEANAEINGCVTMNDGITPIGGAHLMAFGDSLVGKKFTITRRNGGYRFMALPPGLYVIQVEAKGFITAYFGFTQRLGFSETINIRLKPAKRNSGSSQSTPSTGTMKSNATYRLSGYVKMQGGSWKPFPNVIVVLYSDRMKQSRCTRTDEKGYYLFTSIPRTNFDLMFIYQGRCVGEKTFDFYIKKNKELDFHFINWRYDFQVRGNVKFGHKGKSIPKHNCN